MQHLNKRNRKLYCKTVVKTEPIDIKDLLVMLSSKLEKYWSQESLAAKNTYRPKTIKVTVI
jgi:hypothetical protein